MEAAHWRKEGNFTEAVQAYGRACYEFGVTGGMWPAPGTAPKETPVDPTPAVIEFDVKEEGDMNLKGTFFLVIPKGSNHRDAKNIKALCPRKEDAERIAQALQAASRG